MKFAVKDGNKIIVTVTSEDLVEMFNNGVPHINPNLSEGISEIKIVDDEFIIMAGYFTDSSRPWPIPMWKEVDKIVKKKVSTYNDFLTEDED